MGRAVRWQQLQQRSRRLGRELGSVPPSPPFPLLGATGASLGGRAGPTHALAPLPGKAPRAAVTSLSSAPGPAAGASPASLGVSPCRSSPARRRRQGCCPPRKGRRAGSLPCSPSPATGTNGAESPAPRQHRDAAGFIPVLRLTATSRFEPSFQDEEWSVTAESAQGRRAWHGCSRRSLGRPFRDPCAASGCFSSSPFGLVWFGRLESWPNQTPNRSDTAGVTVICLLALLRGRWAAPALLSLWDWQKHVLQNGPVSQRVPLSLVALSAHLICVGRTPVCHASGS